MTEQVGFSRAVPDQNHITPSWQIQWSWLNDGALPLLVTLLRTCWFWPWLALLQLVLSPSEPRVVLPIWTIAAIPLLGFTLSRQLARHWPEQDPASSLQSQSAAPSARIGVGLVGLLVLLVVLWWRLYQPTFAFYDLRWIDQMRIDLFRWDGIELPPIVLLFIITSYLWLRGILDAANQLSHDDVWRVFGGGVAAFALYFGLTGLAALEFFASSIGSLILFFAFGMLALALTNLKITSGLDRALGTGTNQPSSMPQLTRHWANTVLLTVVILLGIGLLLGSLIAPDILAQFLEWAGSIVTFIGRIILSIILSIGFVLLVIAYYIALWLRPLFERLFGERFEENEEPLLENLDPFATPEATPVTGDPISDSTTWIGLIALIVVVTLVFALVLRRLRSLPEEDEDEIRESILSTDLLQDQLGRLWQRWRSRLGAAGGLLSPFFSLDKELDTRQRIRHVYQQLLEQVHYQGYRRPQEQTPTEYRQALQPVFESTQASNEESTPLNTLTQLYYRARYGGDPPSVEEANAADEAWTILDKQISASSHEEEADSK